ncbi:glucose-1-phosphate thymidylyltransferase RfbA [Virgibacillus soli]|uniref:glucose-1-phosphate thymidylyltransferase RfbA n=1 Tax=Paracerasibacillus soli TaxID=480284 RepID=UPI0035E7F3D6
MRGIIMAGGYGSRLYPLTSSVSKQLLPIYDKPMIYYPLSVLMLAGIREVLIISTPTDTPRFKQLLGDGENLGMDITYAVQESPGGIAEAFIIGKTFIGHDRVALILGDNIFYGHGFATILEKAVYRQSCATIFGYHVNNPERYGVIEFEKSGQVKNIEEKPLKPKSTYAVTGLYFYDNDVIDIASNLQPSDRGELEITDVNKAYLQQKKLHVEILGRGFAWLDTGTHASLLEASTFVQTIEKRQSLKVACLEEIAYHKGYIGIDQVLTAAEKYAQSDYGKYLFNIVERSRKTLTKDVLI